MDKEIKIVIGANYGDEGKGLVTYCLTKEAANQRRSVVNVLYNGGSQRGHTANGIVHHALGSGTSEGARTYLNKWFMVDPIALWLENARVDIHPDCRVVLPCDVVNNQAKELERGTKKHGSCGMGIYEAAFRSNFEGYLLTVKDLFDIPSLYNKLIHIEEKYGYPRDLVYNNDTFLRAAEWVRSNCYLVSDERRYLWNYDTIIFEGGQGLLLDQNRINETAHLTPSSPGIRNCIETINNLCVEPDLYYVSRTYLTRHGAGEMIDECDHDNINPIMVDETNKENPWQGKLRYGYLDPVKLIDDRITKDVREGIDGMFVKPNSVNLVYTHLNYTNDRIHLPDGTRTKPFIPESKDGIAIDHVFGSNKKDEMDILI